MASLGWAIVAVIAVNGVFSFLQDYRAERAVAALRALLPAQAKVLREGVVAPGTDGDRAVLAPAARRSQWRPHPRRWASGCSHPALGR